MNASPVYTKQVLFLVTQQKIYPNLKLEVKLLGNYQNSIIYPQSLTTNPGFVH